MAGKRKAEGIALLSLYNDDDEEEEEEEEEQEQEQEERKTQEVGIGQQDDEKQPEAAVEDVAINNSATEKPLPPSDVASLGLVNLPNERATISSPVLSQALPERSGSGAYGIIVDYEHDEAALSPEAEEGEIVSTGRAVFGSDIQASNGFLQGVPAPVIAQVLALDKEVGNQSDDKSEQSGISMSDEMTVKQDEASAVAASSEMEKSGLEWVDNDVSQADLLADFLPPPPTIKCSEELQQKFSKYLSFKSAGRSFNEELRKSKGYRNPDFLQRAVKYQEIDQIGSCFKKEIFDPHGYDSSDFYDALALELRRELDRKEQVKKQNQRVDFVHGVQAAPATAIPDRSKPIVPVLGGQKVSTVPTTVITSGAGSHVVTAAVETSAKPDGRSSKKSKWDKVDTDGRAPSNLPAVAKTAIAAASAHAALLTANAGAGYASFAQQKRKEAEERSKSSDKVSVKSEKK